MLSVTSQFWKSISISDSEEEQLELWKQPKETLLKE